MSAGYPAGAMFDDAAPFNQPSLDIADVRKIESLAEELAEQSFNRRDPDALQDLTDDCGDLLIEAVVNAAIVYVDLPRNEDASQKLQIAVQLMRDAYVQGRRDVYFERAKQELDYED